MLRRRAVATAALLLFPAGAWLAACVGDDPTSPGASADGGAADAASATDAAAEAATDAATGGFCAVHASTKTLVCADFDEGSRPDEGWSGEGLTGSGTAQLESSDAVSAPNALEIDETPTSSPVRTTLLSAAVESQASFAGSIRMRYKLARACFQGNTEGSNYPIALAEIAFYSGGKETFAFQYQVTDLGNVEFIDDQTDAGGGAIFRGFGGGPGAKLVAFDSWTDLEIDVHTGAGSTTVNLVQDGITGHPVTLTRGQNLTGRPQLEVGVIADSILPSGCKVLFDNVIFDAN